jgi:hypothetical protein
MHWARLSIPPARLSLPLFVRRRLPEDAHGQHRHHPR